MKTHAVRTAVSFSAVVHNHAAIIEGVRGRLAHLDHPATIRAAQECVKTGQPKVLLVNLSGHGHFDMGSYDRYFAGELTNFEYPGEAIQESLKHLPKVG